MQGNHDVHMSSGNRTAQKEKQIAKQQHTAGSLVRGVAHVATHGRRRALEGRQKGPGAVGQSKESG